MSYLLGFFLNLIYKIIMIRQIVLRTDVYNLTVHYTVNIIQAFLENKSRQPKMVKIVLTPEGSTLTINCQNVLGE